MPAPRKRSVVKLKDTLRACTKRTNGTSMEEIVITISKKLGGCFHYFKHSPRHTLAPIDTWVRMRLRSILRKRSGRKGYGGGHDYRRWPNAYFGNISLFSLVRAHDVARQSAMR